MTTTITITAENEMTIVRANNDVLFAVNAKNEILAPRLFRGKAISVAKRVQNAIKNADFATVAKIQTLLDNVPA